MLFLRTLGGLAVEMEGKQGAESAAQRAPLAILAFIAACEDTGASRDRIACVFWPESDTEHSRGSLKQALYTLRRSFNGDVTVGTTTLRLNRELIHADAADFRTAIAKRDWEGAVELYRGPFLDGVRLPSNSEFDRWVDRERALLAQQYAAALESLAKDASSRLDHAAAAEWWRRLAATDMVNARIARGYMIALAAAGDRDGAVRHAQLYGTMVRAELETEPDPSIAELARELQAHKVQTVPVSRPVELVPQNGSDAPAVTPSVPRVPLVRRWAVPGLLAAAAGGYLLVFATSMFSDPGASSRVFDREDQILVGDLEAQSPDSLTARALTEFLRTSLSNTRAVTVVPRGEIDRTLLRMELPITSPIDDRLARELAERNGYEAVLSGALTPVAKGYVLSVRLTMSEGRELAALSETVPSGDGLIAAVSRISRNLHRRIEESGVQIDSVKSLPPLTTRSLAALKLFQEAQDETRAGRGQAPRTIALLREAVAADSTFAMAHRFLGIKLYNEDELTEGIQSIRRAERFAYGLSDIERLTTLSTLHLVLLDYPTAADEAARVLELRPTSPWALNQLALLNNLLGRHEEAREIAKKREAIEPTGRSDFAWAAIYQGSHDEALAWARAFVLRHRKTKEKRPLLEGYSILAAVHTVGFSYDSAEYYAALLGDSDARGRERVGVVQLAKGQIRKTLATWRVRARGEDAAPARAGFSPVSESYAAAALANLAGDRRSASMRLDAVLRDTTFRRRYPADRPIPPLMALIAAGRVADARRELAEIENATDADMRLARDPELSLVRGAILLAEKRIPESITALHRASSKFTISWDLCRVCALPFLARAYEEAGRPDSATAIYERYLSTGDADRQYVDAIWRPVVLRRLAELHAKRGDNARATQLLQQFVDVWKDADRELQPQVDAARRRMIALGARPG